VYAFVHRGRILYPLSKNIFHSIVTETKTLVTKYRQIISLFGWLVADGWCWFVLREDYCWLVAGGWFVVREKFYWLISQANRAMCGCHGHMRTVLVLV
jgi:hypothetical protein